MTEKKLFSKVSTLLKGENYCLKALKDLRKNIRQWAVSGIWYDNKNENYSRCTRYEIIGMVNSKVQ